MVGSLIPVSKVSWGFMVGGLGYVSAWLTVGRALGGHRISVLVSSLGLDK